MKKYLRIVFFIVFCFSAMGFRGCVLVNDFVEYLFNYHYNMLSRTSTEDGNIESELYSVAVGKAGAIYTRTGGPLAQWTESQSGTTQDLSFVRANPEMELVSCAIGNSGTVLLSQDNGITWSDHSIPTLSENLYSFDFIYTNDDYINIVVCGDAGSVYRSSNSNGVYSWQQVTTNASERLNSIGAILSDLYIIAGENGKIIKTYDAGLTWEDVSIPDTTADFNRMFLGILVKSYEHAWIVGDNGKIYMTTDYGNTWLPRESGTSENLYDVTFKNPMEGVVAGANGVVRYTSDGGFTWHEDTYLSGLTTRDIVSISGFDENTASAITLNNFNGDAAGSDTTYIFTVSSEPFVNVDDDDSVPAEFSLNQNYPNPFNPSTKISWQSPVSGHQTLKVYDILGNEVATLVDEYKEAGKYEVDFDASTLTSGVYFYRLKISDYTNKKKMILMK
jgi:hypothetical protein